MVVAWGMWSGHEPHTGHCARAEHRCGLEGCVSAASAAGTLHSSCRSSSGCPLARLMHLLQHHAPSTPPHLAVRQDGACGVVEEGHVPHREEAGEHWQVALKGRLPEVVVHVVGALEEVLHNVKAVLQGQGQHAHGGAHRVAPAHLRGGRQRRGVRCMACGDLSCMAGAPGAPEVFVCAHPSAWQEISHTS